MAFGGNPLGYVCPLDMGNPCIISVKAAATISGGETVYVSGAADAVSSGLKSLASDDVFLVTGASGLLFNGVAIDNVSSGTYVGVATRGFVIMKAAGTITAGKTLDLVNADKVVTAATAGCTIGRAWSEATSGGYVLVELK